MSILNILMPWVLSFLGVLMCIPFFTLFERKILSYSQNRKGPNKVGYLGLLQPISDGIKLILKEGGNPWNSKKLMFWFSPLMCFLMTIFLTFLFPFFWSAYYLQFGFVFYMLMISLNVYFIMGSGISSNSKFAFLGAIRGSAQSISYEISFLSILLLPLFFSMSLNIQKVSTKTNLICFLGFPIFFMWLICILAETNRAPFDFAEGESELVSGFNTEYGALSFTLLFLSEYGSIVFMCLISFVLFFLSNWFIWVLSSNFLLFYFIWCRASFPRFRYDLLMEVTWKIFLPLSLFYMWLVFFI